MENHHFCSGWPQEGNCWDQCQAAGLVLNRDDPSSFPFPWPPCAEPDQSHSTFQFCGHPSRSMPFGEAKEDIAASASSSHSQAEKRRRERINAHLETLRKLIPKSDKMDKAALLGSVVEHVKDLKRKALEVRKFVTVPTEVDEVTIDCYLDDQDHGSAATHTNKTKESIFVKASICCEDRAELLAELAQALECLKLTTVRADIACLGGRIKSILILRSEDGKEGKCMKGVVESLKGALVRIASSPTGGSSSYRVRSRRQRFFLPSH